MMAALALLAGVACGGDEEAGIAISPVPGGETSVRIKAEGSKFDKSSIAVTAGARIAIIFTNRDAVPHNVAIYDSKARERQIFVGDIFSGPDKTSTYRFAAPSQPGTYYFQCDIHPAMNGVFIVQ